MRYWTRSWNSIYGCTRIRSGCRACWAATMAKRMQGNGLFGDVRVVDDKGEWTGKIAYKPERLDLPRHWKRTQIVAVNWMGDMFHENVPAEVWPAMYKVMAATPQHRYLVLTKRYDQMSLEAEQEPLENVYLGVTISCWEDIIGAYDPLYALYRGGWRTWVSFEPALEEVSWAGYEWLNGIVCGGESGKNARPMPLQAVLGARDYCRLYKIPFTFKQSSLGTPAVLDGERWYQFPEHPGMYDTSMYSKEAE